MAETGKGFNLAAALASVSKLDTAEGREQIEYIPLDRIDSDPRNFYKLDGLEQLAASIELLGLQQPLRVRQNPEAADRFVIVSGHRRKAALDKLAAACKISAPKLARLPEDFQERLASILSEVPSGRTVEKLLVKYNEGWRWEPELQCPDGKPCKRGDTFLRRDCEANTWKSFCGGNACCLECEEAKASYSPCERMCSKAKAQRKAKKDEAEEAAHKRRQKEGRKYQKETQVYARRLLPAIDAAGVPEDTEIPWRQWRRNPCISQVRQWAAGEFDDPAEWHEAELAPEKCDGSLKTAKLLGCSMDFLMGLTDDFHPPADTEPPPQEGPALETYGTEAGETLPAPEEPVPEGPSQDVFDLDTFPGRGGDRSKSSKTKEGTR